MLWLGAWPALLCMRLCDSCMPWFAPIAASALSQCCHVGVSAPKVQARASFCLNELQSKSAARHSHRARMCTFFLMCRQLAHKRVVQGGGVAIIKVKRTKDDTSRASILAALEKVCLHEKERVRERARARARQREREGEKACASAGACVHACRSALRRIDRR